MSYSPQLTDPTHNRRDTDSWSWLQQNRSLSWL